MKLKALTMVLLVAASGCKDGANIPSAPNQPDEPPIPATDEIDGVQASVHAANFDSGKQVLEIWVESDDEVKLGSYQGRFSFDPSVLSLEKIVEPEEDFRVVNDEKADQGEIRFGAFTVESFASPVALKLHIRSSRPVEASDVELSLEVVGTVAGDSIPVGNVSVPRKLIK